MSKKYSDLVFGKLKEVEIKEILEGYFYPFTPGGGIPYMTR